MKFFRKTRPQHLFESLWASSFHLLSQIWQGTLLIRSEESVEVKEDLLNFLETKSERTWDISEEISEISREIFETFHKQYPEPYKNEWYKFVEGITTFQRDLTMLELRLFLFKDVLMQIDETHPQWNSLNQTLQTSYEKLIKTKSLIDELNSETAEATHNAIVITRSIK